MQQQNANNCLNSEIWLKNYSQREYGCHTPQFTNNLREKACYYCNQWKPASLEELSFSVILENAKLIERVEFTLCHLPHRICWLVGRALNSQLLHKASHLAEFVSEYGATRPSWFDVDRPMITELLRFRLFCKVNQKLKQRKRRSSAGIEEILQYLGNVSNTYEDFWSKMTSGMKKLKAERDNGGYLGRLRSVFSADFWSKIISPITKLIFWTYKPDYLESLKICADESNVVLMKASELSTENLLDRNEFESMKELQRLNKTFACPIVFKPTKIGLQNIESHEILHLLDDIDPEVISDVDLTKSPTWSVEDIDELGRVLSSCHNLSSIYLRQKPTTDGDLQDLTPEISELLSYHHQLQKIGLSGFNLAGTLTRYPLPPVENLRLRICVFTEEDLIFMANRSDLALKTLVVTTYFVDDHFPSLPIFMQSQAKSLEDLELVYPATRLTEIFELLEVMAKFNKLQVFELICEEEIGFVNTEKIIVDLMSIRSTRKFFIEIASNSDVSEYETEINNLNDVVTALSKINRRPPIEISFSTFKSA